MNDISFTVTISDGIVRVFPACMVEEDEALVMDLSEEIKGEVEYFLRGQGRRNQHKKCSNCTCS